MIVVLDMRDDHPAGPFVAFVQIGDLGELQIRDRTPQDARRRARALARDLAPRRLVFGLF